MENYIVELGFIYALVNPLTNEVFYIGATESSPKDRLAGHYSHFKEYLKGIRSSNKRFEYMESIFPEIAKVKLLEIIQNDDLYSKEIEYIEKYSRLCNLTNQTKGGIGGDTFTMQSDNSKLEISKLIAQKANGKPKPEGFGENLSKTRMGFDNPAAKSYNDFHIEIYESDTLLKVCTAPYQITEFLDNRYGGENHKIHAGRAGNIMKAIRKNGQAKSSGFTFKKL